MRAKSGDAAGARAILDRLDSLLDWIEKAFGDRPNLMPSLGIDPLWDGLRGTARFQAVLRRLGLMREDSTASPSR
jgi:hypothetical protein